MLEVLDTKSSRPQGESARDVQLGKAIPQCTTAGFTDCLRVCKARVWLGGTAEGTTASEREVSESICAGSNERLCESLCARRRWVLCQIVGNISGSDALNLEQCVGEEMHSGRPTLRLWRISLCS